MNLIYFLTYFLTYLTAVLSKCVIEKNNQTSKPHVNFPMSRMKYSMNKLIFIAGGKTGYGCLLSIQNKRHAEPHGGGLGIRES